MNCSGFSPSLYSYLLSLRGTDDAIFQIECSSKLHIGDPPNPNFDLLTNTDQEDLECPETHFQCLDKGYCLPIFLLCNKVYDCPGKEDEGQCDAYMCPGHYRCRGSKICVHPFYVCDGQYQCPEKDDEVLCGFSCPKQCVCRGLSFTCQRGLS